MATGESLSKQISVISKSLIGGLLVLTAFAVLISLLIRATFVEYRAASTTSLTASVMSQHLLNARVAAIKWRLTSDPAFVDAFRESKTRLKDAAATSDTDLRQIADGMESYKKAFDAMLAARTQNIAAAQELREGGLAARRAITDIMGAAFLSGDATAAYNAGKAQEALMLGRYYMSRFRRSETPADYDRSVQEIENARDHLNTLVSAARTSSRREMIEGAFAGLTTFAANQGTINSHITAELAARDTFDAIGPKLIADMQALTQSLTDQQNTLGARGQSLATWAVIITLLAAAAIVCTGWYISRRQSRRITSAFEASVQTMTQIAEGDLKAQVMHGDLDNEIGRMARALEVFKSNGIAAIEATARERQAEEHRKQAEETAAAEREQQKAVDQARVEAQRREMISSLSTSLGAVVSAASAGDFSKRVTVDFSDKELGALADDVNLLVRNVEHGIAAAGTALGRVASGDLTQEMEGRFEGAFAQLQTDTNRMIARLKELIGGMTGSTENLAASSSELRETSDILSKQAEQNAAALEETSAALEELSASIKQVDRNISDANTNAQITKDAAQQGRAVASDAADAMTRIQDASTEISKVVGVINDISFQINLLALNAGVEAARAGDAGRGFAVVASEVRQLAQRATEASGEIATVIGQCDAAVVEGVQKVKDAEVSLQDISDSVVDVSGGISDVARAISEQVGVVSDINVAVAQIDKNTQKQAMSYQEMTTTSALLSAESETLKEASSRFNTGAQVIAIAHKRAPAAPPVPDALASGDWERF